MAAALVCAVTAVLSVSTDRSQFFLNDGLVVTCPSDSWSVLRETSSKPSPDPCAPPWGTPRSKGCRVGPTQLTHTGRYWCQSKDKAECTNKINITVSTRTVILESPLFPVKEGQNVTLKCFYREEKHHKPTSDFKAAFFWNNEFRGRFSGGTMLLSHVSKENEGLYKCEHPSKTQSLESQLIVHAQETNSTAAPPPTKPWEIPLYRILCFVFLFLLYTAILCIGLSLYCKWTQVRAEEKKLDSERVSLRRIRNP